MRLKFCQEVVMKNGNRREGGPNQRRSKKGQGIVTTTSGARSGVLTGINHVDRYKNCYPLTAVVYGLYPIREPDQANFAPMRSWPTPLFVQKVIGHFEVPLRWSKTDRH